MEKRKSKATRVLSWVLTVFIVIGLVPMNVLNGLAADTMGEKEYGPFIVTASKALLATSYISYDANEELLTFRYDVNVTVRNKDPNVETSARIYIAPSSSSLIRLAGVNIKSETRYEETKWWHHQNGWIINHVEVANPPIEIAENTTASVYLEIVEGTVNRLTSGSGRGAGIQKSCSVLDVGTLEIQGKGTLYATGGGDGAGIGGGYCKSTRNINIDGPTIYANGGGRAAGIGAGNCGCASYINIYSGYIEARGGETGIGGGELYNPTTEGHADHITISGGTVKAYGSEAGIGGGFGGNASFFTITGGNVTAESTNGGAGIGGGRNGSADGITITGGTVTAKSAYGSGIGGGDSGGAGKNISITGGAVTAIGGIDGAGIGSGDTGTVENITISGGTVKAIGNNGGGEVGAASIGGRNDNTNCSNIKITGGSVDAPTISCQPTNDKGQNVYLFTLPNPNGLTAFVDGVAWNATNSSALDDTNLYMYIPDGSNVKLGDSSYHCHAVDGKISTDTFKFVPCSGEDGYRYHYEACAVAGCDFVRGGKSEHNFVNFQCTDCGAYETIITVFHKGGKSSATYQSFANVELDQRIYDLVSQPTKDGETFKHWYYLKNDQKVIISRNATLRDITDGVVPNGSRGLIEIYAEFKTREFNITGGTEGTDYTYGLDGVLTITSDKAMTVSNIKYDEAAIERIVIAEGVNANITLAGVNIDLSEVGGTALTIGEKGNVTLKLENNGKDNIFISGANSAGIQKGASGTLTILGTPSDNQSKLIATGGAGGSGIGDAYNENSRRPVRYITIDGAYVIATGNDNDYEGHPGIGAGYRNSFLRDLLIKNSRVIAIGIGGIAGRSGSPATENVQIIDSVVTAIGRNTNPIFGYADIGGDYTYSNTRIKISGGSVKALNVPYGADRALLVVENKLGKDIYVDGEKYPLKDHTSLDPEDKNLYLWLTKEEHKIKIGDKEYTYVYENNKFDRLHELDIISNTSEEAVEGTDYSYSLGVLTILSVKSMTVKMHEGITVTSDRIVTGEGVNANITLSGVNIDTSATGDVGNNFVVGYAPITVSDQKGEKVKVTLAAGTVNTLNSSVGCAGLQKGGGSGTLTIDGSGTLNATGGDCGAGIGGGNGDDANNIFITSGTIVATGGNSGAGIGGGCDFYDESIGANVGAKASNITISGGNITANGGGFGAGIGGGNSMVTNGASASNISITGGTVIANGGTGGAAGIGGGFKSCANGITISGGNITANGGGFGAGIGGGSEGSALNIKITGGTIHATGGSLASGIGSVNAPVDGIVIEGGYIVAAGGKYGAGIGANGGDSKNITISGGTVIALGGEYGAGIGTGRGTIENIKISGGTVIAKVTNGCTIGGGRFATEMSDLFITGGSVRIDAPVNSDDVITAPIGVKNNEDLIVYTPKNEAGEEVYLLVIANPDGEDIYINGEKYAPSNHTAADPDDTNLYVYLANGRHTVKLGDGEEKVYHYDKANSRFIETDCVDEDKDGKCDYCGATHICKDSDDDHLCDSCGVQISNHTGGEAKCNKKAVCSICGNEYGEVDGTKHTGNTEVRGYKAASCTDDGYTGDTHCKDCGALLTQGSKIDALGHTGGEAKCNKKAVCELCGNEYGEVDGTKHTGNTEVRGYKAASCTDDGYTGDTHCKDCGALLTPGSKIDALGHTGGEAKCNKKAVCELCGNEYGDFDSTKHTGNTEVRGYKAASCTDDGYTGDTHCKDCGALLTQGSKIDALGHTGGVATCENKPICERCGEEYGEGGTSHSGEKVWVIDKNGHELKWDCCGEIEISKSAHSFYWGTCTECGYVHPFRIVFCFCRIVWDIILAFDSLFEAVFG